MLDVQIRQHSEGIIRELFDEFLQGSAFEVRISSLVAALQEGSPHARPAEAEEEHWAERRDLEALEVRFGEKLNAARRDIDALELRLSEKVEVSLRQVETMDVRLREKVDALQAWTVEGLQRLKQIQ